MKAIARNPGLLIAIALFAALYLLYNALHPKGFSIDLLVENSNECMALIFVAMAQTVPILTGGLDLSVGAVMTLVNCLASTLVSGSPGAMAGGIVACLAAGAAAGFCNGCVVVWGRLQPIIATIATGAIYIGLSLWLRPSPGGKVDEDLSWVTTNALAELDNTYHLFASGAPAWFADGVGLIPVPLLILLAVVGFVWLPFRNTVTGRGCYAVGSAEAAAYMSGLRVWRSKLAAYTLGGFFAGCGGLYLALQTGSGNADINQAGAYTLNSIAAVVIGGTSLFGGSGGAIGSIFGALTLRAISFCFRVFDENSPLGFLANPLLQPIFEGVILLAAVSLGAARALRVKNRLALFT
ncbi:MAG: ABC transporter permease [Acidisphaera sp.]|nr:ABC transporter permease [Acidisphaera sp.]MBV9813852.1 ABC transporter permease [Acetobacteraceae bacterium]